MNQFMVSTLFRSNKAFKQVALAFVGSGFVLSTATPVLAHHAMGGKMPSNWVEGFISGIAHPLIGPDHFAFIVAVGLLATTKKQGILMPVAFILAAMLGTGIHLANLNIPGVELFVSGSILLFGILLAMKNGLNISLMIGLSALAGVFHGYAYGESIFGAQMTPLFAYLAGFTVIQLVISLIAFWLGKGVLRSSDHELWSSAKLRSAGFVICGVGLAFFMSQVMSVLLPATGA
jgi:urease accessory protein